MPTNEQKALGYELHQTISNLLKIRDLQHPPTDAVLDILKALYAKQIELIDAAIKQDTVEYIKATEAMNEAAKKTQEAINDLAKLEQAIEKVANAIGIVADLLLLAKP